MGIQRMGYSYASREGKQGLTSLYESCRHHSYCIVCVMENYKASVSEENTNQSLPEEVAFKLILEETMETFHPGN